ncbi:MAG: HDOD domain-containing protein [Planctomycetota bacterium]
MSEIGRSKPKPLEKVVAQIHDVSTLPHVALKLMEVAGNINSCAGDLKDVMEMDPSLSSRVLRSVNSSAFGLRQKITNLQHAIAYLGFKQVRNLAMTAAVSELFREQVQLGSYTRLNLWRHMVSVGITARLIAVRMSFLNFEDVFLAGLLHDIGIVLEDQQVHSEFTRVAQTLTDGDDLIEVERAELGFDHTQLGARVSETWSFPEGVKLAVRYHHNTSLYDGEHIETLRCVAVANLICTLKGISAMGRNAVAFDREAFEGLSLRREDVLVLSESVDQELAKNTVLFEM